MSNPFDDSDPFASPPAASNGKHNGKSRGSVNSAGLDPAALLAQQVAMRNGAAGGSSAASEKAARMFAASSAAASVQPVEQQLNGAQQSAFNSRDKAARMSIIQQGAGGGPAMAFPMTDMVDAAAEKNLGLSFASLAVREGPPQPVQSAPVQVGNNAAAFGQGTVSKKAPAASPPAQSFAPSSSAHAVDPWSSSSFASTNDPFGQFAAKPAAPVHAAPRPPQQQQQQPQFVPKQNLNTAAAADVIDFDAIMFGTAPQHKPAPAPAAAGFAAVPQPAAAAAPVVAKKKKKVVESSSSSSDSSSSDSEDEAAAAARAKAERKKKKEAERARAELVAQREKERAEAVAYDQARKAAMAERRKSASEDRPGAGAVPANGNSRMKSAAVDADDEEAKEVIRNETSHAKLQQQGAKGNYPKVVIDRWGANPAEHWAYSKSKTTTKLFMPKVCVYWRFVWEGQRHEVELFHSTVSGKRSVRCDGALVASEKLFFDTGSRHDFALEGCRTPCDLTVLICSSGSDYAYELFINRVRFYQALQAWLINLQTKPGADGSGVSQAAPASSSSRR